MPDELLTHEVIAKTRDRILEWRKTPDLTPRESEMLAALTRAEQALSKTYAVAWNLCPPRHKRDSAEANHEYAPGGKPGEFWKLIVFPDFRTHDFNGAKYEIALCVDPEDEAGGWGWTSRREQPRPLLWLHESLSGPRQIEVAVHEALHACLDERMSEGEVDQIAKDISSFVFKLILTTDPESREAAGMPEMDDGPPDAG